MTGAMRPFVSALWREHRLAMLVVAVTSVALMLTEGVGLLMLVPMLRLVGVSLGDGASDRIAQGMESLLRALGVVPDLVGVLAAVVVLVTARAGLQWLLAYWDARLEVAVIGRLRQRLFAAIVQMPWARFTGERPAALMHAIGPQVDDVHTALLMLMQLASLGGAVTAASVVAVVVSPSLTAVVAVTGVVLYLATRALRAPGRAEGERLLAASSGLFARMSELLGGLKMVHAHGAESRAVAAMIAGTSEWATLTRRYAGLRARVSFALAALGVLLLAVLVWFGVTVAQVAPATLLLLTLLYSRLVPRLSELQGISSSFLQALASFDSVTALLARCEAARAEADRLQRYCRLPDVAGAPPDALDSGRHALAVEVQDVTVRYPGSEVPALSHLSARMSAGSLTVIVGPSGAGKTTLGDLLLGLLEPESGIVLVDGRPLAGLVRAQWRARVGYLAQEPMLLHGTIRDNLLFAHPGASEDELREALRGAACDFVERLPQGLDSAIGERGVLMSGGERQRLALARALLRRPGLLVLDEATSALDADTEQRILQTVRALAGRCTVVFCTHRVSVREIADEVIEL